MAEKLTFKKIPRAKYDYTCGDKTAIKLNGMECGYIIPLGGEFAGQYGIKYMGKATAAQLAKNPNCPWAYHNLKKPPRFASEPEARAWIKANKQTFIGMLYKKEMEKDG